jgi:TM2 domain-containing membrane protein YozV
MSYFITESELVQKKKNIGSALAFSLFLGIFGAHRFYMRRYLSGCLILLSTLGTAFHALWIIVPLIVIEFFQLARINSRESKRKPSTQTTQEVSGSSQPDVPHTNHQERSGQIISDFVSVPSRNASHVSLTAAESKNDVKIYDISGIATSRVHSALAESNPYKQKKWTKRLELPYERHDLQIPQIKKSIYQVYEGLAEQVDQDLKEENLSLEELGRRPMSGGFSYYSDILYTLFCVAEGEVTNYYSGSTRHYDNSFSYQLLEQRLSKEYVQRLKQHAIRLCKLLPPPDQMTRKHYGLTKTGLASKWWDLDGELRENYKLPVGIDQLMDVTNPRSTKLYEIPAIRAAIVLHYYKTLMTLDRQRKTTGGWSQHMTEYLTHVFDEKWRYVDYSHDTTVLLNYLLKLCEQAVRDNIPYVRPLNTKKEIAFISEAIPKEAARAIFSTINTIKPPALSDEVLEQLKAQNPTAWKEDVRDAQRMTLTQLATLLSDYSDTSTISKVAKEVVKKQDKPEAKLLAIYQVDVIDGTLDDWFKSKLVALIHPAHIEKYKELVVAKQKPTLQLAKQLLTLQKAPRRRVVLDDTKLAHARKDHVHAVKSVESYLGEGSSQDYDEQLANKQPIISKEVLFTSTSSSEINLTDDQRGFLKQIIQTSDGFDTVQATKYARSHKKMLNGYIQSLNKTLYEKFEDQVIIQQDGKITIEEEYKKAVEELL